MPGVTRFHEKTHLWVTPGDPPTRRLPLEISGFPLWRFRRVSFKDTTKKNPEVISSAASRAGQSWGAKSLGLYGSIFDRGEHLLTDLTLTIFNRGPLWPQGPVCLWCSPQSPRLKELPQELTL